MSKPLELTIYPPRAKEPLPSDPDWQGWDAWREWRSLDGREFHQRRAARFTDAELAAEWWRACLAVHQLDHAFDSSSRALTIHRFATSPHYFEADQ